MSTDPRNKPMSKMGSDLFDIFRPVNAPRMRDTVKADVVFVPRCNFCCRAFETLEEVHEHERFAGHGEE